VFNVDEMFEVSLSPSDIDAIAEALKEMKNPVTLYVFIEKDRGKCKYCDNTLKLVEALASASAKASSPPLLNYVVAERGVNDDLFEKFRITRIPSIAMLDGYIKYTGMPARRGN
jgi:hypothetical protein